MADELNAQPTPVVSDKAAEAKAAIEAEYAVVDPGAPKPPEEPEEHVTPSGSSPRKPDTIKGTSVEPPEELLRRAEQAGISAEEARATPPSILRRLLDRHEPIFEPEPEPPAQQFLFDPYTGQPLQKPQEQAFQFPELDPEKYEPELVAAVAQQNEFLQRMAEQNRQLEQALNQQTAAQQQRQSQDDFRTVEKLFQSDEDYADLFGKGPASSLDSAAHRARAEVAVLMDDMANGYRSRGQAPPDVETLYERAKYALHGQRTADRLAEKKVMDRIRNREGQFVKRPTATTRNNEPPPGPDRAVSAVSRLLREQGRYPG